MELLCSKQMVAESDKVLEEVTGELHVQNKLHKTAITVVVSSSAYRIIKKMYY